MITDDFPCFFLPRMVEAAAARVAVRLACCGLERSLPIRAADRAFTTAYHFRRFLQRSLRQHIDAPPVASPLAGGFASIATIPKPILDRWPAASRAMLDGRPEALASLPIDHAVPPVGSRGGASSAHDALRRFLERRLDAYAEHRNDPDARITSGLSPYLHWGHISTHQILAQLADTEGWDASMTASNATGARTGWWSMSSR